MNTVRCERKCVIIFILLVVLFLFLLTVNIDAFSFFCTAYIILVLLLQRSVKMKRFLQSVVGITHRVGTQIVLISKGNGIKVK